MAFSPAVKSAFSVLLKLGGAGLAFLFYAMISRSMSVEDAGVLFFCIAFGLVLSSAARFGLDHALVRYISQAGKGGGDVLANPVYQALGFVVILSSVLVVATLAAMPYFLAVANLPPSSELSASIVLISIVPMALSGAVVSVLNGLERNVLASFLQTGAFQVVVVSIVWVWTLVGESVAPVMLFSLSYSVAAFVVAIFSCVLVSVFFGRLSIFGAVKNRDFHLLRSALSLFPGAVSDLVINGLPAVLVGLVATPSDVAKFSVPQRISNIVYFFFASINTVFAPKIGRAVKEGSGVKRLHKEAVRLMVIAIGPAVVVLSLFSDQALALFGGEYVSARYALIFLLLAQLLHAVFGPVLTVLVMNGEKRLYSYSMIVGAAVTCFGVLVLSDVFGATGAAVGVLVGVFAQKLSAFFWSRKYIRN